MTARIVSAVIHQSGNRSGSNVTCATCSTIHMPTRYDAVTLKTWRRLQLDEQTLQRDRRTLSVARPVATGAARRGGGATRSKCAISA